MMGHLENLPILAQMPNRSTNIECITVSPAIANTMLAVQAFVRLIVSFTIISFAYNVVELVPCQMFLYSKVQVVVRVFRL